MLARHGPKNEFSRIAINAIPLKVIYLKMEFLNWDIVFTSDPSSSSPVDVFVCGSFRPMGSATGGGGCVPPTFWLGGRNVFCPPPNFEPVVAPTASGKPFPQNLVG